MLDTTRILEHEERIDALIADYLDAVQEGQAPPVAEFLSEHSQFREELQEFFDDRATFLRETEPLRAFVTLWEVSVERVESSKPLSPTDATIERPFELGRLGKYELLELIGQGGMGTIFKARQILASNIVALKVIKGDVHEPAALARFRAEAQALARVNHPNVVRFFDADTIAGRPFVAMEYVTGGNLAQWARDRGVDPKSAALLVAHLADGLEAVHTAGVLHRDMKPGNILVDAHGVPKITDFGLAKLLETESGQTQSGMVLGTPSFMAPEQASGKPDAVGRPADIYGLGATLYYLLTGQAPFQAPSQELTLRLLLLGDPPPPPSKLRPGISRVLDAIVLKCLERNPSARYAAAAELADDLRRFARGESTSARPLSWPRRAGRWLRRRPVTVLATILFFCLLGFGERAVSQYLRSPERDRERIERALRGQHPVELIGESGPPKWYRWRFGVGYIGDSERRDGVFSYQCPDLSLLELAPDSRRDSFRIEAELLQTRSYGKYGLVGIYFGHKEWTTSGAGFHALQYFGFEGIKVGLTDPDERGQARFEALGLGNEPLSAAVPHRLMLGQMPFHPARHNVGSPWRRLILDVTAADIVAQLETSSGRLEQVPLAPEHMRQVGRAQLQRTAPPELFIHEPWTSQGGIGIIVWRAAVSVRNVRIVAADPH